MNRRTFLLATPLAVPLATTVARLEGAPDTSVTVLYGDRAVKLDKTRPDMAQDDKALWVRKADLPRINDFEVKPQGACRADVCIPIPKALAHGEWFNLTGFAHKLGEAYVADSQSRAWSFGEIPALSGSYLSSRLAPDFAVPDRKGRVVHLSSFRGKKVLVTTWASW